MDHEKVYLVIDALANGIDPSTGECFPPDSPYNHPDVIRALFYVLRNKPPTKKQKKSVEEKQQDNIAKGLPKNYGLPWTEDIVDYVIRQFNANVAIEAIAQEIARKPTSIIGLLKKKNIITEEQAFTLGLRHQAARSYT